MKRVFVLLLGFTFISYASVISENFSKILKESNPEKRASLIESTASIMKSPEDFYKAYSEMSRIDTVKNKITEKYLFCADSVKRPYVWYVPETYDKTKKTPLLVYLHGGINREVIEEDRLVNEKDDPYIKLADEMGFIILFPFGQIGATWFDDVGMDNIEREIKISKKHFNIDDNKIFMTGFSDGASASFFYAFVRPDMFAGYIPLNGHMGVGSIDFKVHCYAKNLANSKIHAINTDIDHLYPDSLMRPMIDLVRDAGANISYRVYEGIGHDFTYLDRELPIIGRFMESVSRNSYPDWFVWESAEPERFGKFKWFSIDGVKEEEKKDYVDHNMTLYDKSLRFGFYPDDEYSGKGVRVSGVVDGESFCGSAGVLEGDVIVSFQFNPVDNIDDLEELKGNYKHGDFASMGVEREGEYKVLAGKFPEILEYELFTRLLPSGIAEGEFISNEFHIKGQGISEFSIYISPDMVNLERPVKVIYNNKTIFNEMVIPDYNYMLRNFFNTLDGRMVFVKKLTFEIK